MTYASYAIHISLHLIAMYEGVQRAYRGVDRDLQRYVRMNANVAA